MWEELENTTGLRRDGNASRKFVSEQPWVSVSDMLSNGSAHPQAPGTDAPSDSESGIVPGVIAAAVFISFLLALYAVLWKCMVTAPKRQEKKKRQRARELRVHMY
ncbi:uncharacterized protein sb:cb288 [Conger conger]|uniref:uncharacterized protein sb:cb288 n=1 Tax=Conger conger TaxID=82655 RepID=UPI002A5A8428|nr:uncharacterized protein sb:cb288 [Conger conger]